MQPQKTYELKIVLVADNPLAVTKQKIMDWLIMNGVESFVEGVIDCDINHDYESGTDDFFSKLGGDDSDILIYRYDFESLLELKNKINIEFAKAVKLELSDMETKVWVEGWKESFKPFKTNKFYVRPPWVEKHNNNAQTLIDLVVEPGMAFGTGQHATTKLCIEALENLTLVGNTIQSKNVLDVGTGTGILAVAAAKLDANLVVGTDIEVDAVNAARGNLELNGLQKNAKVNFFLGTFPTDKNISIMKYDVVVANILTIVLLRIVPKMLSFLDEQGVLILSGILSEEKNDICELASKHKLILNSEAHLDEWCQLSFKFEK